jgi:hypothetical protein
MGYSQTKMPEINEAEPKLTPLHESEINQFIEDGFVVVRQLFSKEYAEGISSLVCQEADIDFNNLASRKQYHFILKKILNKDPIPQIFSPQYKKTVDKLCGEGQWEGDDGLGYWFITSPNLNQALWSPAQKEWHLDSNTDYCILNNYKLGLIAFHLITNVSGGGGGTAIRIGSHKYTARILAEGGLNGISYEELSLKAVNATIHLPYVEITGQCGDVMFMHPLTVHARSINTSKQVRIAGHKFFHLLEPLCTKREHKQKLSPVEISIINVLSETE